MKRAASFALALWAMAIAPASAAAAPTQLETLRKAFASAVAAKDRAGVANLSRFPLAVEVYGSAPKVTQQKFLSDKQYFDGWFFSGDATLVKCLRTQPFVSNTDKALGAGAWLLDCNGNEYYFGERAGQWAFVGYQNINE